MMPKSTRSPAACRQSHSTPASSLPGWQSPDFDDGDWGKAQVITPMHIGGRGRSQPPTDPYGPLLPRPIAKLGGERLGVASVSVQSIAGPPDLSANNPAERAVTSALTHPSMDPPAAALPVTATVPEGGYARLVLDMGRIVGGLVTFSVDAPAGTVFDFGYFEEPVVERSMFGAHGGNRYVACGLDDARTVFDPKGFRYGIMLIHGVSGEVTLNDFAVQEVHYPWQPGASFECSDADLNDIYQASIRTVALNSWDAFMDCPTREQRAWVGDAVVHQMVHLVTNTDWRLAWHYLELGNSPRPDGILPMSVAGDGEADGGVTIPDWSLHWVHGVHNLYRFTGDHALLKSYMPTIERILRWFLPYQTESGVLQDVVEWNLIDWSSLFQGTAVPSSQPLGHAACTSLPRWPPGWARTPAKPGPKRSTPGSKTASRSSGMKDGARMWTM